MQHQVDRYVEYQIVAECDTNVSSVFLMLSGNARLHDVNFVISKTLTVSQRTAQVTDPWFPSPQDVQIFRVPVQTMSCPPNSSASQLGTAIAIGGKVERSFETSRGSNRSLQLPLVGDETHVISSVPALGGAFGPPIFVSIAINAGVLPLQDQITVSRPMLADSSTLRWSGPSFIRPSASWTDLTSDHRNQFLIFLLGAVIAVLGSLLVGLGIEVIRKFSDPQ